MSVPRRLAAIAMVLATMTTVAPAAGQAPAAWRLADPLPSVSSLDVPALDAAGGAESDLGALGSRLSLRYFDVGIVVSPRRPWLTRLTEGDRALPGSGRSRLGEFGVSTTDIGLDLRLRWPSSVSSEPSGAAPAITPYLSLGPALAVPIGEEPLGAAATRSETGVSLGMRGALGLEWHLAPGTSLFGEYRVGPERGRTGRTSTDSTLDLLYGLSIRF